MVTHVQDGSETPTHALRTLYLSSFSSLLLLSFHCLSSHCFSPCIPTFQPGVPRVHELYLQVCLCSNLKPSEMLVFNPLFRQAYLRENTAKSSGIETMGPCADCFEIQLDVLSHMHVYPQLLLQRRVQRQKMCFMRISLTQIPLLLFSIQKLVWNFPIWVLVFSISSIQQFWNIFFWC